MVVVNQTVETNGRAHDRADSDLLNAVAATYVRFGQYRKAYGILLLSYSDDPQNEETLGLLAMVSIRLDQSSVAINYLSMLEKINGKLTTYYKTLKNRAELRIAS